MKIAIYARVSTEEQARNGASIEAQLAALREWAKAGQHIIVGEYIDAGISGKKPYTTRPELSRFMTELRGGLGAEALVFCKLDRFFRSVKLYYQAVDVMEKCGCAWLAVQEDYETVTAAGRFKANIMLAVAENEADRTGERIRAVFDYKRSRGDFITGEERLPLGYALDGRKPVIDAAEAEIVRAAFSEYQRCGSVRGTAIFLRERFSADVTRASTRRMLRNRSYIGELRDNPQFFPSIITREQFDAVQDAIVQRGVRRNRTGRVYIFSGLVFCASCGRRMGGRVNGSKQKAYFCPRHAFEKACTNNHCINEARLEHHLMEHVAAELDGAIARAEQKKTAAASPAKPDRAAIEKKLDRLKDLYVDGLIDKERYRADFERLNAQLAAATMPQRGPDLRRVREIVEDSVLHGYAELDDVGRQRVWRSVVRRIAVDDALNIELFF